MRRRHPNADGRADNVTSRTFLGVVALLLILLGAGNTRGIVELFFVWLGVDQALDWGRPPYHLPVFEWWEWPVWCRSWLALMLWAP